MQAGRWTLLAVTVPAFIGCAGALVPPRSLEPERLPLEEGEIGAVALLIQAADRRVSDASIFAAAAASPSAAIRAQAALAAGRIRGPESASVVRALLEDADTSVSANAAFAAGLLRDTVALPLLATLLDTAFARVHPTVAAEAAAALGRLGIPAARGVINTFLIEARADEPRLLPVVEAALLAAWRSGETGLQPYARWLDHPDAEVRWRAAFALGRPSRASAVPVLFPMLADADPRVRAAAVRGLAREPVESSGAERAAMLDALDRAVTDPEYSVQIEAIRTLGTYPDPRAAAILGEALGSSSAHRVLAAIEALVSLGPAAAPAANRLATLAADPASAPYLREVAVEAVATLAGPAAAGLLGRLEADPEWRVRAAVARSLRRIRREGVPALERLARDPDPRVATAAVDALVAGLRPDSVGRIRPLLLEILGHADPRARAAAIRGLGWIPDPALLPALLDAYGRAAADVWSDAAVAAIDALADLGHAAPVSPARAFFTRFPRPSDPDLLERTYARFPEPARAAWGPRPPVEPRTTGDRYLDYTRRWLAPVPAERPRPRVRIVTDVGSMEAVLFPAEAPLTVANFLELAGAGFFDGQIWSRMIPNFVVQGGDPRGDTSGGPGYTIRDEPNRHRFVSGSLGMALSGADTGGSQFFITHSPQPNLDGTYTVFGRVVTGLDVLERILPGTGIVSVREIRELETDEE